MLYLTSVKEIQKNPEFFYSILSPLRRNKLNNLKSEEDQLLSIAVEAALLYGLIHEGFSTHPPAVYEYDAKGKPVIQNGYISLSHSGQYAACAIHSSAIGVDIQRISNVNHDTVKRLMTPDQIRMCESLPASRKKTAYEDFWTCKEALYKADNRFSVRKPSPITYGNENSNLVMFGEEYRLQSYSNIPGYSLSVCCADPFPSFIWNLSGEQLCTGIKEI